VIGFIRHYGNKFFAVPDISGAIGTAVKGLITACSNNNNNMQDNVYSAVNITKSSQEFICGMENSTKWLPNLEPKQLIQVQVHL